MPPSFVRRLRNNTAQSDGATVKLGAHILAAVAARTLNRHIPLISALRISVRLSACVQSTLNTKQTILRNCGRSFLPLLELIAKIFCAVEIAKTSAVSGNRHCVYVSI